MFLLVQLCSWQAHGRFVEEHLYKGVHYSKLALKQECIIALTDFEICSGMASLVYRNFFSLC